MRFQTALTHCSNVDFFSTCNTKHFVLICGVPDPFIFGTPALAEKTHPHDLSSDSSITQNDTFGLQSVSNTETE